MSLYSSYLQGNEAFTGKTGLCPLSGVPSDCGAGGQLVPSQTLACQERPGTSECEHNVAS